MTTYLWKRAIIVGASSGIGAELAQCLSKSGCRIAIVARRQSALDAIAEAIRRDDSTAHVDVYAHDVNNIDDVAALFSRIVERLGGLDLIIYAAGIMPQVEPGEYDVSKDAQIIATNLTGAVAWLNEAARRFAKMGNGTIVGISSVAGDRGRRGNPVYGATKAALNAYLESLRNRIERRGASVVTIKAGPVNTPMTAGLTVPGMVPVETAAAGILDAARCGVRVAYVPERWRIIMAIIRAIPPGIFKWLNI